MSKLTNAALRRQKHSRGSCVPLFSSSSQDILVSCLTRMSLSPSNDEVGAAIILRRLSRTKSIS